MEKALEEECEREEKQPDRNPTATHVKRERDTEIKRCSVSRPRVRKRCSMPGSHGRADLSDLELSIEKRQCQRHARGVQTLRKSSVRKKRFGGQPMYPECTRGAPCQARMVEPILEIWN